MTVFPFGVIRDGDTVTQGCCPRLLRRVDVMGTSWHGEGCLVAAPWNDKRTVITPKAACQLQHASQESPPEGNRGGTISPTPLPPFRVMAFQLACPPPSSGPSPAYVCCKLRQLESFEGGRL